MFNDNRATEAVASTRRVYPMFHSNTRDSWSSPAVRRSHSTPGTTSPIFIPDRTPRGNSANRFVNRNTTDLVTDAFNDLNLTTPIVQDLLENQENLPPQAPLLPPIRYLNEPRRVSLRRPDVPEEEEPQTPVQQRRNLVGLLPHFRSDEEQIDLRTWLREIDEEQVQGIAHPSIYPWGDSWR